MQKKINLLSTLLIIALVLGALSTCSGPAFRAGMDQAEERAKTEYRTDHPSSYQVGYEVGGTLQERMSLHRAYVRVVPEGILTYPDSLYNVKTGEMTPAVLESFMLGLKEVDNSFGWVDFVAAGLALVSIIAFILMLLVFVTSIKSGGIFVKGNERILRWMAVVFFVWYALDWVTVLTEYATAKANVSLMGYTVAFEAPSFFPLVVGITFLLFAQIFAKGRRMEEDQEFMV